LAKRRASAKRKSRKAFQDIEHILGGSAKAAERMGVSKRTWESWKSKGKPSQRAAKKFARLREDLSGLEDFDWYVYFVAITPDGYRQVGPLEDIDPGVTVEDVIIKFRITNVPGPEDIRCRDMTGNDWEVITDAAGNMTQKVAFEAISAFEKWQGLKDDGFAVELPDEVQLELL
jgi:hypothetical protein